MVRLDTRDAGDHGQRKRTHVNTHRDFNRAKRKPSQPPGWSIECGNHLGGIHVRHLLCYGSRTQAASIVLVRYSLALDRSAIGTAHSGCYKG